MGRIIIGLTGAFGSGASFIADNFLVKNRNFNKLSLSSVLKDEFQTRVGKKDPTRSELQNFGNKLRKDDPAFLAKEIDKEISKKSNKDKNYVIDSIRNPAEISYFRDQHPDFILLGVYADYDVRWARVKSVYHDSKDEFDKDERKDQGIGEEKYGQRITDCFFESDIVIHNNEPIESPNTAYNQMEQKIKTYLDDYLNPLGSRPTSKEALMATAYTYGRYSECLKRKVGAVIANADNRVISSGYNGVPRFLSECKQVHGKCYRDVRRNVIAEKILKSINVRVTCDKIEAIKSNIKVLELCRALHAEESAIMNLVGKGIDMKDTTMFVTTYPCNLCANKIVQAGISKVIYFEPYPVQEAKEILNKGKIETEAFEGVTFRAFFRFYNYQP